MVRKTRMFSRQWRATLRKHGLFALVFAAGLLAVVAFDAVAWWHRLSWDETWSTDVLETQVRIALLLASAAWAVLGVDPLLCHGVSRRTIVWEQSVVNAASALCATVVVYVPWAVTRALRTPLRLTLGSERFLYTYSLAIVESPTSDGGFQGVSGEEMVAGAIPPTGLPDEYVPRVLPLGMLFVFLAVFVLMLGVAMAGQLAGVVLAKAKSHGIVWFAVVVSAIVAVAGGFRESLIPSGRPQWLWDALKGGVGLSPDGDASVYVDKPVVWIPLGLSVVFAALVVWVTWMLTKRREVMPVPKGAVV
ncbi:hypothetical protein [Bifidobacterium eulemuris]|uniref:Uncharacterized protein n=1 Tax=Bifidobacterium eulemuris TaxID=1765219 RepID=A0A261GA94_9BIFI|nr:hypothetical protein [Bifidobacterium eulemuris]OZG68105.1 hypothetical protein BEUL_1116 [Bifidobacterium eulemuris]QOL31828.1 hypothetical protein BE0216_04615 [Bifidobacterium eulemuris]